MSEVTVTVVDHPLAAERLRVLRDETTSNARFRDALEELGGMLVYEATRNIPTVEAEVRTPLGMAPGRRIDRQPLLVPILRAGIGLLEPAFRHLPDADAGFVGLARDEETFAPKPYVNKLPDRLDGRPCIVLDPMLATGGSLELACRLLLERNVLEPITVVCVLAAPEGIEHCRNSGIGMHIVTASIDSHLNDQAFIVPGLGDAGDRQFGRPI
ncbi:MAG: uracil phosphoribosyltransferase [Ilumatobacteraceae bacterium]